MIPSNFDMPEDPSHAVCAGCKKSETSYQSFVFDERSASLLFSDGAANMRGYGASLRDSFSQVWIHADWSKADLRQQLMVGDSFLGQPT